MKRYAEYSMVAPAGARAYLDLPRWGVLEHLSVEPRRRHKEVSLDLVLDGVHVVFRMMMSGHKCIVVGIDLASVAMATLTLDNGTRWDASVDLVATFDDRPTRGE